MFALLYMDLLMALHLFTFPSRIAFEYLVLHPCVTASLFASMYSANAVSFPCWHAFASVTHVATSGASFSLCIILQKRMHAFITFST